MEAQAFRDRSKRYDGYLLTFNNLIEQIEESKGEKGDSKGTKKGKKIEKASKRQKKSTQIFPLNLPIVEKTYSQRNKEYEVI